MTLAERVQAARNAAHPDRPATVEDLIRSQRPALEASLPEHMDVEKFSRVLLSEVDRTPQLLECSPESLLGAWLLTAQLGLNPGPAYGEVYLIPRWNRDARRRDVSWMLGYRGMIELARRSGRVDVIEAHAIHAEDDFAAQYGAGSEVGFVRHRPALPRRGDVVGAWAMVRHSNGADQTVLLDLDELESRRARSETGRDGRGPWRTDFPSMARKSGIRKLEPFLPRSAELVQALSADEGVARVTVGGLAVVGADELGEGGEPDLEEPQPERETITVSSEPVDEAVGELTWTRAEVEAMKVPELREALALFGETPSGTKPTIRARLLEVLEERGRLVTPDDEGSIEPEPQEEPEPQLEEGEPEPERDVADQEDEAAQRAWVEGLDDDKLSEALLGYDVEPTGDPASDRATLLEVVIGTR